MLLRICLILCLFQRCLSDILIVRAKLNITVTVLADLPSLFGPTVPLAGLEGLVVYTHPEDGCSIPASPPHTDFPPSIKFIALVRRYNCSFVDKVLNSQKAGFDGVIVRNVGSNAIEVMSSNHNTENIHIPSVFIGADDGILIERDFQYNTGYYIVITDDLPFNIQTYLLPFAITIGICFVLMLTFMGIKCLRDYRRSRRHRLSSRALKNLPIHKFCKGDPYDCCAVCLDDYQEGDKLRVLPCCHAYHAKCIDPWLTKNRRVCPVCKRKVLSGDERPSDIETDSEDEASPLVNSEGSTQGGTFVPQRENPFQAAHREAERRGRGLDRLGYHQMEEEGESSVESGDENGHSCPENEENEEPQQSLMQNANDLSATQVQSPLEACIVSDVDVHNENVGLIAVEPEQLPVPVVVITGNADSGCTEKSNDNKEFVV